MTQITAQVDRRMCFRIPLPSAQCPWNLVPKVAPGKSCCAWSRREAGKKGTWFLLGSELKHIIHAVGEDGRSCVTSHNSIHVMYFFDFVFCSQQTFGRPEKRCGRFHGEKRVNFWEWNPPNKNLFRSCLSRLDRWWLKILHLAVSSKWSSFVKVVSRCAISNVTGGCRISAQDDSGHNEGFPND